MSINNLPVRIRKKNKTKGDACKFETIVSKIMSKFLSDNKDVFLDIMATGSAYKLHFDKDNNLKIKKVDIYANKT